MSNDKADGLARAERIETNNQTKANSGMPWKKHDDGASATKGGPTSGGKIKRG